MKKTRTAYGSVARIALATAVLLMIPLVAMQVTDDVAWGPLDFIVAGTLLFGTGLGYELVARKTDTISYRAALGIALAAALLLIWINLAVGILGSEDNPANWMYVGVLAVGIIGAGIARLRPLGMARAMVAASFAQALVAVIALIFGLGSPENEPLQILVLNGFFVALFVGDAWLFRRAARAEAALGPPSSLEWRSHD